METVKWTEGEGGMWTMRCRWRMEKASRRLVDADDGGFLKVAAASIYWRRRLSGSQESKVEFSCASGRVRFGVRVTERLRR